MANDYESNIHLRAICQLNLRNRQVGAYLLEDSQGYSLRFGLAFPGVHPFVGESKILSTLKAWNDGIKGFPAQEIIRIHQHSYSDSRERYEELEERGDACVHNPGLEILNYHQQTYTEELSAQGKRCLYSNQIFTSWGYRPGESAEQDLVENLLGKTLAKISDAYLTFKGEKTQEFHELLREIFSRGFDESFLRWERQLNTRMGLRTKPMQSEDLWSYAWKQFNLKDAKEIPHLIIALEVDGKIEIEEKVSSKLSPASVLIRGDNGSPSVPQENFWWQKNHGKYTAAVVVEEKLEGYGDEEHQFKYWWLPFLEIPDCEIVWEAQLSNSTWDNVQLQRTLKFQKSMAEYAEEKGGYSVVADEEVLDSKEAQRKIYRGDKTVAVSVVFFLTRKSPQELNTACQMLADLFPSGKLIRDTDIVPELWRNKQPFINRRLVGSLRRHTYLSSDLSLPVLTTKSFESRGMEFITFEGKKPIYLDTGRVHHNRLTAAQTRKGKSTKTADEIFTDLSCRVPALVLDYGMVDGRTTYSDMVDFLGEGGANIEVASTYYNLLQTPNLEKLTAETRKKREGVFQASLLSVLETIVLGEERGTRFAKRVRSMLDSLIVLFFESTQIQARYEIAHRRGMGSREWSEMPTLRNFKDFVAGIDPESTNILAEGKEEILMMLGNFIRSPFGQSFSRPSSVKLHAPLLNFSLRGARNEEEESMLGIIAQNIATTRAMEYLKSSLYVDEGSILFEKPVLVQKTAETVVNGGKSGISVSLIAQDIPSIAGCAGGSKFLTNTDIKMIGKVDDSDIPKLAHHLDKPPELFERNARDDFEPDSINLCSHWLMLAEGTVLYLSHYPSPALMALVASNRQEQKARERYFSAYGDPIEAISMLAVDYQKARQTGMPMSELAPPVDGARLIFA